MVTLSRCSRPINVGSNGWRSPAKNIVRFLFLLSLGAFGLFAHQPYTVPGWLLFHLAIVMAWLHCFPHRAKLDLWLIGCGYYLLGCNWLSHVLILYAGIPLWLAWLAIGLFAALLSLFFYLKGLWWTICQNSANRYLKLGYLASGWMLIDVLQAHLLTGFPWLLPVFAWVHDPIGQGYLPVLGTWGCDWLFVFISGLLFYFCQRPRLSSTKSVLLLVLLLSGVGLRQINWSADTGKPLAIYMVQGNVPQMLRWNDRGIKLAIRRYFSWSKKVLQRPPGVLIWPEGAIPLEWNILHPWLDALLQTASHQDQWGYAVGSFYQDSLRQKFQNRIVTGGIAQGYYAKRHLVPMGEFWPRWLLWLPKLLHLPLPDLIPGIEPANITVADQHVWAWICYELLFEPLSLPTTQQKVDWLLVVSNDAWFGNSLGPWQHLELAQWRAAELSRWLVVSTNSGVSAIIDSHGRLIKMMPIDQQGILAGQVISQSGNTPARRYPFWCWPSLALLVCSFKLYRHRIDAGPL